MAIAFARDALSRVFYQRCFYLFILLVALFILTPLIPSSDDGRFVANLVNTFVVVATVAAVGRTVVSFIVALLLAAPTLAFQWLGLSFDDPRWLAYSWGFGALLYAATIVYLLEYVFRPDVMTTDKLFGAAAGYLMLGVFWAYLYRLIGYYDPASFAIAGQKGELDSFDALYFSITVLTSTGFGDIAPLTHEAKAICMIEQIVGVLFAAILIARLASAYSGFRKDAR
jgi:Ion channel